MNFDQAFEKLIDPKREGVYSNDSSDRGNWTGGQVGKGELKGSKYGISAARYPHLDIKNLSEAMAKAIYYSDYWRPVVKDYIPDAVKFALFDMAVNSGEGMARRTLQQALGVVADGNIGPKTKQALAACDPAALANRINAVRLEAMTDFKGWEVNSRGWARRIAQNILDDNPLIA